MQKSLSQSESCVQGWRFSSCESKTLRVYAEEDMRIWFAFLLLCPLAAWSQWNYTTISSATDGHIASRTVNGVHRRYVAHRNASNALVVRKKFGAQETISQVWANIFPSRTHVTVGPSGVAVISFWSVNRFRLAIETAVNGGNCGSSLEWRCIDVPFPTNTGSQGAVSNTVVGMADSSGRVHVFYKLVKAGLAPGPSAPDDMYYTRRESNGSFVSPFRAGTTALQLSPQRIDIYTVQATPILFLVANGGPTQGARRFEGGLTETQSQGFKDWGVYGSVNPSPGSVFYDADGTTPNPGNVHCVARRKAYSNGTVRDEIVLTEGIHPSFGGERNVHGDGPLDAPLADVCSIVLLPANSMPGIAFATTGGAILYGTFTSLSNPLIDATVSTVDDSSLFIRPVIVLGDGNKPLVMYQGAGFLKLAQQQ